MVGGESTGVSGRKGWLGLAKAASRVRTDITFALIDAFIVVGAYVTALALRMLDPSVSEGQVFWADLLRAVPFIVVVHLVANALAGAYGHTWEYASLNEATRLGVASTIALLFVTSASLVLRDPLGIVVPTLTLVAGGLLTFLLAGLVRFRSRLFSLRKRSEGPTMLVVGSGPEAAAFARRVADIDGGGRVLGLVTDSNGSPSSRRLVADLEVMGCLTDIPEIVEALDIDQVVIAGDDPQVVSNVVDVCLDIDVRLRIVPKVEDIMRDHKAPLDVRDINVEDLLVREKVETDLAPVAEILRGKRVLVTGGGGSIGSEIVRQVLGYGPEAVWALDRDETLLHEARLNWSDDARIVLCDVRDAESVLRAVESIKPHVIFHAAALKHVPILEDFPSEAVMTNVIGTRNVIEAASRVGAERFVLISTDKAVDPTSVMGASKAAAELLVKAGVARNDGCVYTAVRFGNVLGSRGSVIPTFVSQIRAGGPVTVTDPKMKRYFMTVGEAVQLVLQASALSRGSEVFLLDMGESVRIDDLARRLIRLAGLIPDVDIDIEYTGVRPGEKLEEQLATGPVDATSNLKVFEVKITGPRVGMLAESVEDLEHAALHGDETVIFDRLYQLINRKALATVTEATPEMAQRGF